MPDAASALGEEADPLLFSVEEHGFIMAINPGAVSRLLGEKPTLAKDDSEQA